MHPLFGNTGNDTGCDRPAPAAQTAALGLGLGLGLARRCALALPLALMGAAAMGQTAPASSGGIYSCVDERGRRLTSDRPIPECLGREQRVLNRDGSLKTVRPPTITPEERAQAEAREREAALARATREEALRRDRQLLQRYRHEQQHQRSRAIALEAVQQAQARTQARLAELSRERRPLDAQAEFHQGKPLPPKLKAQIDANDAAQAAQRDAAAGQRDEAERINRRFDAELERLRRLWSGAAPGSLGPLSPDP